MEKLLISLTLFDKCLLLIYVFDQKRNLSYLNVYLTLNFNLRQLLFRIIKGGNN